ncbi:GTPase HflX [Candidatus Omnitrophota bacterium]
MEKALLVGIQFQDKKFRKPQSEDSLQEIAELAKASGAVVVEQMECQRNLPTAALLLGRGKAEEIADVAHDVEADVVIFDDNLSSTQQRNLEELIQRKTIDRTQLILDIFSLHAKSMEGKIQVELAQLEYMLPRLAGKGIVLSRLGGGIGTRGPGEQKLEVDRRRIQKRITKLKKDLADFSRHRENIRKKRKDKSIPCVSLVGYTNAGKTTLLNTLCNSQQVVRNSLFTTLDSLSRTISLENKQKIVISDTVGFLSRLPHHLIEAFKATLEEVVESDLLLHVLDVSHVKCYDHSAAVYEVLEQLNAHEKPLITVLNKIDMLADKEWIQRLKKDFPEAVAISALTKENISELLERIEEKLSSMIVISELFIPINRMDLIDRIYQEGEVYSIEYTAEGAHIQASLPVALAKKLTPYNKE